MGNPIVILELWIDETGGISGTDNEKQMIHCQYDKPMVFIGKTKTYVVYLFSDGITREAALEFCTLHDRNQLRRIEIDLSKL